MTYARVIEARVIEARDVVMSFGRQGVRPGMVPPNATGVRMRYTTRIVASRPAGVLVELTTLS
jgi:hypothetical protein